MQPEAVPIPPYFGEQINSPGNGANITIWSAKGEKNE